VSWTITSVTDAGTEAGAPNEVAVYGCGTAGTFVSIPIVAASTPTFNCTGSGPIAALLLPGRYASGIFTNYPGFASSKGNTPPTDAGTLGIAVSQSWVPTSTTVVDLSHMPANYDVSNGVTNYEYANGYPFQVYDPTIQTSVVDPDAGTASVTFPSFPGFPDFVQSQAVETFTRGGATIATRVDQPLPSMSFDLSQYLPEILSAGVDALEDPVRPIVAWTPVSPLGHADGTYVQLTANGNFTWTFLVPPSVTRVQAPALPADAGTWTPGASFTVKVNTVEWGGAAGYGAFRQLGTALLSQGLPAAPALPAAGTFRSTTYY
jgi:hypothetical protein